MNCYFDMTGDLTAFADEIGQRRYDDAVRNGRGTLGHAAGDDILAAYVRGARAEMAFYMWLGGKGSAQWNTFFLNATFDQLALPDITYAHHRIDVKLRPKGWRDFIVRCRGLNQSFVYVMAVDDFYPTFAFRGWLHGHEVAARSIGGRAEVPGHIVELTDPALKDCMVLKHSHWA